MNAASKCSDVFLCSKAYVTDSGGLEEGGGGELDKYAAKGFQTKWRKTREDGPRVGSEAALSKRGQTDERSHSNFKNSPPHFFFSRAVAN